MAIAQQASINPADTDHACPILLPVRPGTLLRDRYRLVSVLGAGRHGVTYLAGHQFLSQTYVVKVLPRRVESAHDPEIERLRQEAAIGFRISDPSVVRVIDADAADGIRFLVMEHIDGVDLREVINSGARMPPEQIALIAREVLGGLAALHRVGLIHRDIKPSNLMLGADGRARIIDLGVVGFIGSSDRFGSSDQFGSAGTFAYAAPELHLIGGRADQRSDLYSLGVVLFQLCTGRLPFDGPSPFHAMLEPHCRSARWPDESPAPAWWRDQILALLAADPAHRPQSADAVRCALEHHLGLQPADRIASPEADAPVGVAIGRFDDDDDSGVHWLGLALAQSIARQLSRDPELYVADSEEMQRLLDRMHGGPSGAPLERRCAAARLMGAGHLVEGHFRQADGVLTVDMTIVSTGDLARRVESVSAPVAMLGILRRDLVRRIHAALRRADLAPHDDSESFREIGVAAQECFFRGKQAYLDGNYEEAARLGREAITLDPDFGEAVGFVGVCAAKTGRYDEAAEFLDRQQRIAAETGDARLAVEALANLGAMHYYRGEYERAFSSYAAAAQAARDGGFRGDLAKISSNLGFVLLQLGRREQAEAAYRKAIETHQAAGARASLIGPFNGLGNVLREQGRHEDARSLHRRAIRLSLETHDQVNLGIAQMYLGRCESECGRFAQAKRALAAAMTVLEGTRFWNGLTRLFGYLAEMNLQLRDGHKALRSAERMIDLARKHKNQRYETDARALRARAAAMLAESPEGTAQPEWFAGLCLARPVLQTAEGSP